MAAPTTEEIFQLLETKRGRQGTIVPELKTFFESEVPVQAFPKNKYQSFTKAISENFPDQLAVVQRGDYAIVGNLTVLDDEQKKLFQKTTRKAK